MLCTLKILGIVLCNYYDIIVHSSVKLKVAMMNQVVWTLLCASAGKACSVAAIASVAVLEPRGSKEAVRFCACCHFPAPKVNTCIHCP